MARVNGLVNKLEEDHWARLNQNDKAITYNSYDVTHKMTNYIHNNSDKIFVFSVVSGDSAAEAFVIGKFLKQKSPERPASFTIKYLATHPKNLKLTIDLPGRVSGAGTCALRAACDLAVQSGSKKVYTFALLSSVDFYKQHGFVAAKEPDKTIAAKKLVLKEHALAQFTTHSKT